MEITIDEFRSLPQAKKLDCLFENQKETLGLMGKYKVHYRASIAMNTFLLGAVGFVFTNLI